MTLIQGVNASLPVDCPYQLREGHLDTIDISLPFPNLWSGPLSLGISSIHLTLDLQPPHQYHSDPDEPHGGEEWSLDKSVYDVSSDFVRTVLDPVEDEQLQESLYGLGKAGTHPEDLDPFNMTDPGDNDDETPQAPGGFPGTGGAFGGEDGHQGGSARMVEGLIEALLARLQISVGEVVIRLHHEIPDDAGPSDSSIDLELRVEGIRYALSQAQGSDVPKKTLTVDDVGVWMSSREETEISEKDTSPVANSNRDLTGADMMMSLGIADLRQSLYDIAPPGSTSTHLPHGSNICDDEEEDGQHNPGESLYESAMEEPDPSDSNPPSWTLPSDLPHLGGRKIFGLRSRGIVFQMWKEVSDAEEEAVPGDIPPMPNARISIDLGYFAAVLDNRQIESLLKIAAAISRGGSGAGSAGARNVETGDRPASTTQLQVVASRIDLQYLYAGSSDFSTSAGPWSHKEIVGADNLHLSLQGTEVIKHSGGNTVINLSGCSLIDAYRNHSKHGQEMRRQPIMLLGTTSDQLWLPSSQDAERAMSWVDTEKSASGTQVNVTLTRSGKATL